MQREIHEGYIAPTNESVALRKFNTFWVVFRCADRQLIYMSDHRSFIPVPPRSFYYAVAA